MPAAPRPPSQNEMYWKPTLTSLRRPSSVISPGVDGGVEQLSGETSTSSRWRSIWLGLSPSTASNCLDRDGHDVRVGDPGAVEAGLGLALLVLAHRRDRPLVGLGVLAGRDQRGHAAHRERAAARGRS